MAKFAIPVALGSGLAAGGALVLWEGRATAGAFAALYLGLGILAVTGWRWLGYERERLLRWSDERRAALAWRVRQPHKPPGPGRAVGGGPVTVSRGPETGPPGATGRGGTPAAPVRS